MNKSLLNGRNSIGFMTAEGKKISDQRCSKIVKHGICIKRHGRNGGLGKESLTQYFRKYCGNGRSVVELTKTQANGYIGKFKEHKESDWCYIFD